MSFPILPKNVDVSKLRYSEVRTLASGSKSIYINYGTQKLRIQTPVMHMPYGVGEGYEDKNKAPELKKNSEKKYDITLSFKGSDENPKIQTFLKSHLFPENIFDIALDNSSLTYKEWKARGIPTSYLVNQQGRIQEFWVGTFEADDAKFIQALEKTLQ